MKELNKRDSPYCALLCAIRLIYLFLFCCFVSFLYLCSQNQTSRIMTTLELNAQIWRDMAEIADSEPLMKQLAKYLKKLVAQKSDPTLMTKEEFFARVDEAREEIRQGKGKRFSDPEEMNAWLNSL